MTHLENFSLNQRFTLVLYNPSYSSQSNPSFIFGVYYYLFGVFPTYFKVPWALKLD